MPIWRGVMRSEKKKEKKKKKKNCCEYAGKGKEKEKKIIQLNTPPPLDLPACRAQSV
jgi:hypothetical protein